MKQKIQQIVTRLKAADALIISAGAGMGVDSGLPDFRGDQGFWNAYPMYKKLGLSFVEAANPRQFESDPNFAWGFYGHRLNLYRATTPHQGFDLVQNWIQKLGLDSFVVTSNVDGQFQKAGFAAHKTLEVHGSIHHSQCLNSCKLNIWNNQETIKIDETSMMAKNPPACKDCGGTSRPNILMFGDWGWLSQRTDTQEAKFAEFLRNHKKSNKVVIELGAGSSVPTIRNMSARLGLDGAFVVRINPREPEIMPPNIGIELGGLEALERITRELNG